MTASGAAIPAAVAATLTAVTMPGVISLLQRRGVLDTPNGRSSHVGMIPRGAGLVVVPAVVVALLASGNGARRDLAAIALAGVGFGVIGFVDDVRGTPAVGRLLVQLGLGAVVLSVAAEGLSLGVALVAVVWVVGFVNAFNFMDGANGLAGVQTLIAGASWWVVAGSEGQDRLATIALVLAAAAVGFLPFNFPRARIFLGDVGSYGLGAMLAVVVVLGVRDGIPPEAMVAPLALFGLDTSATLVRRARLGQPLFESHRQHAYQQLLDAGWSHGRVTLVMGALMVACSLGGWFALVPDLRVRLLADGAILGLAGAYVLAPALLTRRTVVARVA